jgi:hypothetical protein
MENNIFLLQLAQFFLQYELLLNKFVEKKSIATLYIP